MNKQFYIHIGIHKTGTTSLQKMLAWNRPYLKSKGLLYPTKCTWRGGHHNLAWEILDDSRANHKHGSVRDLQTEIKNTFKSVCLLSSEDLSRFGLQQKKELYTSFKNYQPKIIVYIRNQFDYIVSSWSTVIRNETVSSKFEDYYNFCMKKRLNLLNYFMFLEEWANVFGKENLIIKIYNKNLGENLHEDFINLFKVPNKTPINMSELKLPERSNTSLPYAQLNVIRVLNNFKLQLDYDKRTDFVKTLLQEIDHNFVTRSEIVPPKERTNLRKHTDSFFEVSNRKVAQKYFNRDELFI